MKKILGIKKINCKNGNIMTIVSCSCDIPSSDKISCEGAFIQDYIVQGDCSKLSVGKDLVGFFGFSNGKNFVQSADCK